MGNQFIKIAHGLGNEMYRTSCHICGGPVYTWVKRYNVKFKCRSCRERLKAEEKEKRSALREMQAERRLEIAIEFLKSKGILGRYFKAIDIVKQHLHRDGWFQSSNEILVALELVRNGIKVRHQVRFGRWKADFVLPELKIVLEVDGILYHRGERKEKDKLRDAAIIAHLGPEWEIIRITEDLIKKDITKLVPAIKKIKSRRATVRKMHNYALPEWYSENHI